MVFLFLVSYTRGGSDTVGRVVRLESSGEILGSNQGKVILDRKHFSFLIQVIHIGHLNAAGGYAEGKVLDSLEFLNKGTLRKQMGAACMKRDRIRDI